MIIFQHLRKVYKKIRSESQSDIEDNVKQQILVEKLKEEKAAKRYYLKKEKNY